MLFKEPSERRVYSSSRISSYLSCPRKYMLQSLMRLRGSGKSVHLVFGSAWHESMEHLYLHNFSQESAEEAIEIFRKSYLKEFDVESSEAHSPKSIANGVSGIIGYINMYAQNDLRKYNVLNTEVSGRVQISEDKWITFRLDAVVQDRANKKITCIEHKTGSQQGRVWEMQWENKFQLYAYNHVLHSIVENKADVYGILVNGAFFYKAKNRLPEYNRVLFKKGPASMYEWLCETRMIFDDIERRIDYTLDNFESEPSAPAFPKNGESCTSYGGCAFFDLCTTKRDILHLTDPPHGYEISTWEEQREPTTFEYKNGRIVRND